MFEITISLHNSSNFNNKDKFVVQRFLRDGWVDTKFSFNNFEETLKFADQFTKDDNNWTIGGGTRKLRVVKGKKSMQDH